VAVSRICLSSAHRRCKRCRRCRDGAW
jgi:hypothetical protein